MSIFGIKKHKRNNSELGNKMNIPLDMSGNSIINLGNPEKPSDAVSKRFVFRKIKSVIDDYELEDIKNIKDLLQTEKSDIDQLNESIKYNEEAIITLHGQLQKEMTILSESLKDLDKTDNEIKVALRQNILLIADRIDKIKNSMIKHNELKNKLAEVEKKLQNMYKLEIKEEIKTLKDDSTELFNTFSEKFDEFKAQLEQSASQRNDAQDGEINNLKVKLNQMKDLLTDNLQKEITRLDVDVKKNADDTRDAVNKIDTKIESLEEVQTKRVNDLGKTILDTVSDLSEVKRAISDIINNKIYHVPLFHMRNDSTLEVKVLPTTYEIGKNNRYIKTHNLFKFFNSHYSPVVNYNDYIEEERDMNIGDFRNVSGFTTKKDGTYYINIKLIIKGKSDFLLIWQENYRSENEDRTHEVLLKRSTDENIFEDVIKQQFLKNTSIAIIPVSVTDQLFTIEKGSYIRFTYSWE